MPWLSRKAQAGCDSCVPVLTHLDSPILIAIWLFDCHLMFERKRALLKISSDSRANEVILRLEGEVTQPWTDELERVVTALCSDGNHVVLEMSAVRFIDAQGVDILHKWSQTVVLSNCTLFLKELLKERSRRGE